MPDTTFIYVLKDPDTGEIRYVGKANDPRSRLTKHLSSARFGKNHAANWIRSIVSRGQIPDVQIIDEASLDEWQSVESAYIEFLKASGCPLVNTTLGGDGTGAGLNHPFFGKHHSKSAREKISVAGRRTCSLETREKIGKAQRGPLNHRFGRPESIKTRELKSRIFLGRKILWADKISKALTGKVRSLESRRKQSESRKGIEISQAHRNKIAESGRKTREKKLQLAYLSELWG